NVRHARPRRHVPVDPADVVAGNVRTNLRELGPVAEEDGAVVAGKQSLHPPPDAELERAEHGDRHRAGSRPRGGRSRSEARQCAHAALFGTRSIWGAGTAASTSSSSA